MKWINGRLRRCFLGMVGLAALALAAGCGGSGEGAVQQPGELAMVVEATLASMQRGAEGLGTRTAAPGGEGLANEGGLVGGEGAALATATPAGESLAAETMAPTLAPTQTLTATATPFETGKEITIGYLRSLAIEGNPITIEQELERRVVYRQYIASYLSEGNRIYGLLTVPMGEVPAGGFKAIVFNHGYIPPSLYQTTERYVAYVDYLARSGFVVFKIDMRGHGRSEGLASGSYFSPGYTIDAIAALKSLQQLDYVDPDGIGMWGHSMAGNLVLRAMLVEPAVKAGVIWAGAVYSYEDFVKYGIDDNSFRPASTPQVSPTQPARRRSQEIYDAYGRPDSRSDYWKAVSLTENLGFLNSPVQLHHAEDDTVVNIGYSFDLAVALQNFGKAYEFYAYDGGGHNITSPFFEQAMQRTVEFFRRYL